MEDPILSDTAAERLAVLARIPLLQPLGRDELARIAERVADRTLERGQTLCREGDAGDSFFVVWSGELEVWGGGDKPRVINRLGPGEFLGEITLLTGGRRTATVTAACTTRLLVLSRELFDRYLSHDARVLEHLSRVVCQRLARVSRGHVTARRSTAIAVVAQQGLRGSSLVADALAGLLQDFSGRPVALVRVDPESRGARGEPPALDALARTSAEAIRRQLKLAPEEPDRLSVGLAPDVEEPALVAACESLAARLGETCPFVVFDLGGRREVLRRAARHACDVRIEIVAEAAPPEPHEVGAGPVTHQVVNLHNRRSRPRPINHSEPFVLPEDAALRGLDAAQCTRRIRTEAWSSASPPLRRLARSILGTNLGLALGGGAAFGIAHVGVLKVLEDAGIPVDMLAGTSFGSIVAIGYAAGIRPDEMLRIARRTGTVRTLLSALDFTLAKPSLLRGDRVVAIFAPMAGPVQDFEQLLLPCRAVAADIRSGERVVIGAGRLADAFRASCAVPVIWPPVARDGRVLVDGSIVDPVPAEVVREMGAQNCIAINAVPGLKVGVETLLSRAYRRLNDINPLARLRGGRDLPSLFDVVMNSIQTLQYELGNFKAISADLRINPDLSEFTWLDFHRPMELIERGATAAERALPEIRRMLAERLERTRAA